MRKTGRAAGGLAALACLVVAGGSASGQAVYGPVAPAAVTPAPEQPVPPGIPPKLVEAAQRALQTYPALAVARTQIRASQSELRAARWLRFPSVTVEAATRGTHVGVFSPEVQVFEPLWAGGRVKATIDRASALRSVAIAGLSESALDVLLQLSAAYFDMARTKQLEALYTESLSEHRRLVESMQRRVNQEVSPRSDLELARARAAQVEQQLGLITAQHDAAAERFFQLVGDPHFDVGPTPAYSSEDHPADDEAVTRAVACDPTTRRFKAQVDVADADRRASKAAILPQLGVQYTYDRFGGSQLGLAVRAQTSGGLSPLALAEAASAREQAAKFQVTQAQREVSEKVALDLVENRSARTRMESTSAAALSSRNVTESFLRQFVAGRRTWLDVMNAVREAIEAQAALVEVQNSAMASAVRLQLRTCAWTPDDTLGIGS